MKKLRRKRSQIQVGRTPASMTPPDLSNTVINTLIDVVGVLAAANVYMIVKIKEMKSGKPMKADVAYGLGLAFGSAIMSILSLACLFMDYNPIWAGISLIISACFLIGSGINMIQGITELSTAPIMYMFGVVGFSWSFLQLLFSYKELEYKLIYG